MSHTNKSFAILTVDDSLDNCVLYKALLRQVSMNVQHALNGLTALELVATNFYDLILMDLQMPGMDGFGVVRVLRQSGFERPIIALSGHVDNDHRKLALDSGFDGFLAKSESLWDEHLIFGTSS